MWPGSKPSCIELRFYRGLKLNSGGALITTSLTRKLPSYIEARVLLHFSQHRIERLLRYVLRKVAVGSPIYDIP
jgi:hypothetical protein